MIDYYPKTFGVVPEGLRLLCKICKTRQADKEFLKIPTCKICRDKLCFKSAYEIDREDVYQ